MECALRRNGATSSVFYWWRIIQWSWRLFSYVLRRSRLWCEHNPTRPATTHIGIGPRGPHKCGAARASDSSLTFVWTRCSLREAVTASESAPTNV